VSTVFGSVFHHTRLKILTLPKCFVPGPLYVDYINLLLGTDTIFSSQTFHSQETGAVRQSRSPRRQRGVTTVVQAVAASAMTMAEGGRGGEVERGWMWQWMAALRVDAAIDGIGVVGCCRRGGLQWRWRGTSLTTA
jgi:hypothetical protein